MQKCKSTPQWDIILYSKDWQTLSLIIQCIEQWDVDQWKLEEKIWKLSCEVKHAYIQCLSNSTPKENSCISASEGMYINVHRYGLCNNEKTETPNFINNGMWIQIIVCLCNGLLNSCDNRIQPHTQLR